MANETTNPVRIEDVAGVRSRVSWGAVLGGAAVALACLTVLTMFFAAIGVSLTEADVRSEAIGIGAVVAAIVTIILAMFVGGWVTSQLTAGETMAEATLYGIVTWAVVTAFSLGMVGMGVRAGYFALVGGALVAENGPPAAQRSWEDMARAAGVSQDKIDAAKAGINPDQARVGTNNPADQERARRAAVVAAWAALVGTLVSIGAAIGGACAGCGPSWRLFPIAAARRQEIIVAR